jgi:hypothetical protein
MKRIQFPYKPIPSFPQYEVSQGGVVRKVSDKSVCKPFLNVDGYVVVAFWHNNKVVHRRVHRLVMEAWVGKDSREVNHIDGDKQNNRLSNLEYVTHQENVDHAVTTGLVRRGEDCAHSKLTDAVVKEIRELHNDAGISLRDLAGMYDVSQEMIVKIVKDRNWRHV